MIPLIVLHLRTRRVFLLSWLLPLLAFTAVMPPAYAATYPEPAQFAVVAEAMRANPGLRALYGVVPDPLTAGSFTRWEAIAWTSVLGCVMEILLAVRLTRATEDDGTAALVQATGTSAAAAALAAVALVTGSAGALGAGTAVALLVWSPTIEGLPATGCLLTGAAVAVTSAGFGAVGLLAGQIASAARTARGLALASLGAAFAARAIADVHDIGWLRGLSPLGWRDVVSPFGDDRSWPLIPMAAASAALSAVAVAMACHRDLGAAWPRCRSTARVLRRGPAPAPAGMGTLRLRWQLERGGLLAWGTAIIAASAFFLAMTGQLMDLLEASPRTAELVRRLTGVAEAGSAYIESVGALLGLLAACATVRTVAQAADDELSGLLVPEFTAGVPRHRSLLAAWIIAVTAVAAALAAAAVLGAAAAGASVHGTAAADIAGDAAWSVAGQLPAAVAAAGVAAAAAGLAPRRAWLAWVPVAWSAAATFFGGLLSLPRWVADVSYIGHPPHGADGITGWGGTVCLIAIGVLGAACGAAAISRRDLVVG